MSLLSTATMKSSGVSRFLSRRDKHRHEKRASQPSNSKVCLHSSASFSSLTPLLRPPSEAKSRASHCSHHRHSQSLEALYHKLPTVLRNSVEDGFLFFQRNTTSHPISTPSSAHDSTRSESDQLRLQPKPSQVSPDLYTIFTKEDAQATADKDAEKKVCC